MKLHAPIDKAGRVVIPKALRDRLGLDPGTQLELEVDGRSIILRPQSNAPGCLREKEGLLVLSSRGDGEIDHRPLREERLDRVAEPDS